MSAPRVKLTVEYDGEGYDGFQSQPGGCTVQDRLEAALRALTGLSIRVAGAGRTDAGVHALGQVVAFDYAGKLTCEQLTQGLNAWLPADVAVVRAEACPAGFDPRRDAFARTYEYRILNRAVRSPLLRGRALHVPKPLDVAAMNRACAQVVGIHDFRPFASEEAGPVIRLVLDCACWREGDLVFVRVRGSAFAKRMVRRLVGCLLQIGLGRWQPEVMGGILIGAEQAPVPPSAPARGLYLVQVDYAPAGARIAPRAAQARAVAVENLAN